MLRIDDTGPQLTESDVSNFEVCCGLTLPKDFKSFLLQFNGGRPTPDTIRIGQELGNMDAGAAADLPGKTNVDTIFGLRDPMVSCNLDWNFATFKERLRNLPNVLLPIACDSGGSIFCLTLSEESKGRIVYCDLECVFAKYGTVPGLYEVAASFEEFLSSLKDD